MKNSLKSAFAVFVAPVVLVVLFQTNVIKTTGPSRGPGVEQSIKPYKAFSNRANIYNYLVSKK